MPGESGGTGWNITELAERLELRPGTVSKWIKDGLVTAEVRQRGCKGYSVGMIGLLELVTVAELRRHGFTLQEIKRAVRYLHEFLGEHHSLASANLVAVGSDLTWESADGLGEKLQMSVLHHPGQLLLVFPAGVVHRQLVRALEPAGEERDLALARR
jgi:DNA-binding transcriptional MerR regulator